MTYRALLILLVALLMAIALYIAFAVGITAASRTAPESVATLRSLESVSPLQAHSGASHVRPTVRLTEPEVRESAVGWHPYPDPVPGGAPSPAVGPSEERDLDATRPTLSVSVRETANPRLASTKLAVTASWYCNADAGRGPLSRCTRGYPDGPGLDLYAAVSPDFPRGTLRVCAIRLSDIPTCVTLEAIDCLCSSLGIDLYADAFAALGDLRTGLLSVTVRVP